MRKFLLTFVVLVAGAMSAWAEGVAKIGDVSYASLAEAVNAAQDGETIVLLQDFNIESDLSNAAKGVYNIAEGKSLTLDLGGNTITATDNSKGNFILFYNYGELTVKNGTINLTATINREWNAQSSIILNRGGVLTIESGSYVHTGGTDMAIAVDNSGNSFGDAYLTVAGGTIQSKYIAIRNRMADTSLNGNPGNGEARITVTGGVIKGTKRGVWGQITNPSTNALGSIEITGGIIEGGEDAIKLAADDADNIVVSISGTAVINGNISGDANDLASSITGGTFTTDVTAYCAEGFVIEDNGDGTFGVVEKTTTYEINDLDGFLAFRAAVNAGNSFEGMTVRLNVDLNFNKLDWTENIGNAEHPFEGIFDGQGKSIKNLYFASRPGVARDYLGLFGVISGGAVIKNVVLEDLYFVPGGGGQYVGTVVAYASNGVTIEGNVVNQLKVEGTEYVGGLVGYASNDVVIVGNTVQNLTVQGKISVGAIAGKILAGVEVVDNTIINVQVSASAEASTAAVVAGTFEDGVIISGTDIQGEVKVNGTSADSNVLGTAVKVGDVYYTTLEAAYNDESSDVISIELLGEHELSEAVSYTQNKDVEVNGDLTYTRKLTEYWNPLYLPFEYEFDAKNYDVAEFTSADGTTLTLTHVEGTNVLEANKAYVIRPKSEGARLLEIELDKKILKKAATNLIDLKNGYKVMGNNIKYTGADFRTEFGDNSLVVGTNGNWGKLKVTETSVLKPFRLILTIPSGAGAVSMRFVKGTTVVEEVELDMQQAEAIFDLSGRRVETMIEGGVYIVNGKKVIF